PSQAATIGIIPYSGIYDGQPHGLVGTATGSLGQDLSNLLRLGATKTHVGHYDSIAWSFAGNKNYDPASGISSIDIDQAEPTVIVTAVNVNYDGAAHPTTAEAYGVGGVDLG